MKSFSIMHCDTTVSWNDGCDGAVARAAAVVVVVVAGAVVAAVGCRLDAACAST